MMQGEYGKGTQKCEDWAHRVLHALCKDMNFLLCKEIQSS